MTMTDQLPAPLVPAHVDLRGLPYMPLDVNRLRDSQLAISANGEEFRAAVLLWCASWNQVPAASLPEDDQTLAAYAGFGRDIKGWKKSRPGAMRGFQQCSDGRWYHPVVAEKALEAWEERKEYRDKRENEAARLKHHRDEHKALRDELREYGVTAPWNEKIEALRAMVQHERQQRDHTETETRTGELHATANKGREEKGREGINQDQEKSSLRSDSSSAAPTTSEGDQGQQTDDQRQKTEAAATRLHQHTINAITAYNAVLGKPNGLLPKVSLKVGVDTRRDNVRRCRKTASEISLEVHEDPTVTPEFWTEYFGIIKADPFKSGEQGGGKGHENWTPDFEYLTRKKVMLQVFDKAVSEGDDE